MWPNVVEMDGLQIFDCKKWTWGPATCRIGTWAFWTLVMSIHWRSRLWTVLFIGFSSINITWSERAGEMAWCHSSRDWCCAGGHRGGWPQLKWLSWVVSATWILVYSDDVVCYSPLLLNWVDLHWLNLYEQAVLTQQPYVQVSYMHHCVGHCNLVPCKCVATEAVNPVSVIGNARLDTTRGPFKQFLPRISWRWSDPLCSGVRNEITNF